MERKEGGIMAGLGWLAKQALAFCLGVLIANPIYQALIVAALVDVVLGVMAAGRGFRLAKLRDGLRLKVMFFLMLAAVHVAQSHLAPGAPAAAGLACCYLVHELVSLARHFQRAGGYIPHDLGLWLDQVERDEKKQPN